jgi:glycosyltransferase involved in cell wall biosynthesis
MNGNGSSAPRRLLVVSHPCVVAVNQEVYRELTRRGWDITLVVPDRWSHAYSRSVRPQALPGMEQALTPLPVVLPGRQQRHLYRVRAGAFIDRAQPDVAFLEAEPYALAATQWGRALASRGVPFGVQCYENIDRPLPGPVKSLRRRVLRDAAFVAARSQTAAELARDWGAVGEIGLAPPAVPFLSTSVAERPAGRPFTVGYAGRLTESKGLLDLLAAARSLGGETELVLIGGGELAERLAAESIDGRAVRVVQGVAHDEMAEQYAQLDVFVLPSHTTPTWKEQFGRVLVEALWCGVPVVGSSSGEIPWVIGLTGGGLTFPEGDVAALAAALVRLRDEPGLASRLASTGRDAAEDLFSVPPATDALERLIDGARA